MADRIEVPMLKRTNEHDELETQCSVCGEHEIEEPHTPSECHERGVAHGRHVQKHEAEIAALEAKVAARRNRANYLGAPQAFRLAQACRVVWEAFGNCYLVGSCLQRRDFRDVDVRVILDDAEFDRLFPGITSNYNYSALWSLMCSSIALQLSQASGLPVDFQIQRMTEANAEYSRRAGHDRQAIGLFSAPQEKKTDA